MLRWIIEKIKKNRYKLLAAVSFGLAGYFIYRSYNDEHKIKLSTFLNALSSDRVDNVVVKGEKIFFKSEMSDWYYSNIGNYPINSLFNQLKYFYFYHLDSLKSLFLVRKTQLLIWLKYQHSCFLLWSSYIILTRS